MAYISSHSTQSCASATARAPRMSLLQRLASYAKLQRSRRALARLDDCALSDIGLSVTEAHTEARRPFWDAPSNWRA